MKYIVHFDIDCFYCQVEHIRLGIPLTEPLAVQQWNGLIAVNYEARKYGITRHESATEAKKKCPQLRLVHVPTFVYEAPESLQTPLKDLKADYREENIKDKCKACLESYRRASRPLFDIMQGYGTVEKASIDEAYIDISELVERVAEDRPSSETLDDEIRQNLLHATDASLGVVVGFEEKSAIQNLKREIIIAAVIGQHIRGKILERTGFTCSTGVSINKTIAKICSAMNKPNNQTVLPTENIEAFMRECDLGKIRNFGGKFGDIFRQLGHQKAGDLWQFSHSQLKDILIKAGSPQTTVDSDAAWVWDIARGQCSEKVEPKEGVKSMLSAKSVHIPNRYVAGAWLRILVSELYERLMEEWEDHQRWPKTMILNWRTTTSSQSKSVPMTTRNFTTVDTLLNKLAIGTLLQNAQNYPLSHISLSCTGFIAKADTGGSHSITKFLKSENNLVNVFLSNTKRIQKEPDAIPESDPEDVVDLDIGKNDAWSTEHDKNAILFKCQECGQVLCRDDDNMVREHADFHFAQSLDPHFKRRKLLEISNAAKSKSKKKTSSGGSVQLKLSSFFKA